MHNGNTGTTDSNTVCRCSLQEVTLFYLIHVHYVACIYVFSVFCIIEFYSIFFCYYFRYIMFTVMSSQH